MILIQIDTNNVLDAAGAHEGGENETVASDIKDGEAEILLNVLTTKSSSPPTSSSGGGDIADTTDIARAEEKAVQDILESRH